MSYMFEKGNRTSKNIGINSTENDLRRIYRNRIAPTPGGIDVTWRVNSLDRHRRITFEVQNGKVVSFWTALYPASEYDEGCL